jgi:hypothetical protein
LRILSAALAGAVVRFARRLAGRPPRIWHGFSPLHSTAWMVQAERKAGFPSISVVTNTRALRYALVRPEDFDRVFEMETGRWDDVHWHALIHLLLHGDIWNAYFDCLFANASDHRKNVLIFRLIRSTGIRIVVQPHGGDLACLGIYHTRYQWPERMQLDYPTWDLAAYKPIVEERVALFARFADFVVAGDSMFEPALTRFDASFHAVPVDVELLRPTARPRRDVPVIIHAPNHRNVKGTPFLLEALETLRKLGFAFELRLIESVPRPEALKLYEDADIIADQFIIGAYGVFALEGLALGKPVLTYLDEEHLTRSVFNDPLVNTTLENMTGVLAALIAVPELRERLGAAGRASAVRYHSFDALAEVWGRVYDFAWRGKRPDFESTVIFETARGTRSLSEDPAAPEFWPVPVDDLMPQIAAALKRSSAGEIGSES